MKLINLTIITAVLFTACSKNDDLIENPTQPVNNQPNNNVTFYELPVSGNAQFQGSIDGLSTNWVENQAGVENNATVSYTGNNTTLSTEFILREGGSIVEKLVISKRYLDKSTMGDTSSVRNFLTPSECAYSLNNSNNGVVITYIDSDNKVWTSKGENTGSTFSIKNIKTSYTNPCTVYTYQVKTKIDFACKLYNNGNSITISGSAVSKFAVAN